MNYYDNLQQDALAAHKEMRGPSTMSDQKGTVICPKPRRLGAFNHNMPTRPLRLKFCEQGEGSDIKAGAELLDIIFKQSYYGEGLELHANYKEPSSSPPFFHGSPPVRAANPLIHDAQFGYENCITSHSANAISSSSFTCLSSPSSSSASSGLSSPSSSPLRKGGCVRMKFGLKSAAVRVVGFDCQVPAVA